MTGFNIMPVAAYAVEISGSSVLDETGLLEKYPNAKVIHVSVDEYQTLENNLKQRGYSQSEVVPLHLIKNDAGDEAIVARKLPKNPDLVDDCAQRSSADAGEESLRVMVDFTQDLMESGTGPSGDDAAIVFVIVGTVVVVVWSLYVFKYLFDVSQGYAPCGRWDELTVVTSSTSTSRGQHARFEGLRYSKGFREGSLDVGIGFELGQSDILLSEVGTLELKGRYWLLGPILRWRLTQDSNPNYFQMNFMGGSTEHDEIGLLAKASLGLLFGIGDSLQLGMNWGVLNIDLNEKQGIITERNQYHFLFGINIGFGF